MQQSTRFQSSYVAMVALTWQSLERVDRKLDIREQHAAAELQLMLQILRMELLQLSDRSHQLVNSGRVSPNQNSLVQSLVARLLALLDLDASAPAEVARMRIRQAQNWLFAEALEWSGADGKALHANSV